MRVGARQAPLHEPNKTVARDVVGQRVVLEHQAARALVTRNVADALQPILLERAVQEQVPVVVLARTLTPNARDLVIKQCAGPYLAMERDGNGTRVFTRDWPDGKTIVDCSLWDLGGFIETLIN